MTEPAILLPRPLVQQLFHLAQASPDSEICGLISAANGSPHRCYPVRNVAGDPAHLFDMDDQGQVNALRDIRERGETLFAIYHSHPYAPPEPSAKDCEQISFPEAYYLIISLNTKGVLEMRAWQPEGGALRERPLKIIQD